MQRAQAATSPQQPQQTSPPEPVVDEDPVSAREPLSKVLALDFMHGADPYGRFDDVVRSRLRRRQFEDLDLFAADLRRSKLRLPGGAWRLTRMYERITEPPVGGEATENDWKTHLDALQQWMDAHPESVTARIAFAESMTNYAWLARGSGQASEVKQDQWELFFQRLRKGEKVLLEAKNLPARCPHWYVVMQGIAQGLEWDRAKYEKLFDEAVAFEPLYPPYYYSKAVYLLPRWYGAEGESEKFLSDSTDRIGGEEGGALFYFVFTRMQGYYGNCSCGDDDDHQRWEAGVKRFWPRIKQGYSATDRLYHITFATVNDYCQMAYIVKDRNEARIAFARIGANWDENIWDSKADFDKAKQWAFETSDRI
jgi:hypothetical protein